MSKQNWGRELLVRAGFLAAGVAMGLGYGVGARADHVQPMPEGVEYIMLEPQECDQVAAEVSTRASELQTGKTIERTEALTANAREVAKYIVENNDLAPYPPDVLFFQLLQMCYMVQGQTDVPVTH